MSGTVIQPALNGIALGRPGGRLAAVPTFAIRDSRSGLSLTGAG
jgi:hypothetical protein